MPKLVSVDVYPYSGHDDQPWSSDPDVDAFARSARRVCEAYSRALAERGLQAGSSTMQLLVDSSRGHDDVRVTVSTDLVEGGESAHVDLPRGVAALHSSARALLALDVVHGAVLRLAQARAMDIDVLEQIRQHVVDDGLRFVWTSKPKTSPDRRHTATVRCEMADDGFGRAQLLVLRRVDGELLAASAQHLAAATSQGFTRAAKTLRWLGSGRVGFVPFSDWLGTELETVAVDVSAEPILPTAAGEVVAGVPPQLARPSVVVEGCGTTAPEGTAYSNWIQAGGISSWEGYDLLGYRQCLQETVRFLADSTQWRDWWAAARQPAVVLYLHLPLAPADAGPWLPASLRAAGAVTSRRFEDRVEVNCRSDVSRVNASIQEVAAWVHADVSRAVDKLSARFRLTDHPLVPALDQVQLMSAQRDARALNVTHDVNPV